MIAAARVVAGLAAGVTFGGLAVAAVPAAAAAPRVRGVVASTAAAGVAAVPTPRIDWGECGRQEIRCALVPVPLDYDQPHGRSIRLAMAKLPATDPARRIGTLFVNPGGPGGSGVDFVTGAARELYSPQLRARFDIVGVDPRGIARSAPVQCFPSDEAATRFWDRLPPVFPVTWREEVRTLVAMGTYGATCGRNDPVILRHVSTANVARDFELLRRAVGDDAFTFAGYSYGSYVGATYANLFPDRVRAVLVDGVLDPVAWATGRGDAGRTVPFSTRLRSGEGTAAGVRAFLRACEAAGRRCAFSRGDPTRKLEVLLAAARREPLVTHPGEPGVRYDVIVAGIVGSMYFDLFWPGLAVFLQQLYEAARDREPSATAAAPPPFPDPTYVNNFRDGFNAVVCADTTNPRDPFAWPRAADRGDADVVHYNRFWTWQSQACAAWPARDTDRYTGPFTTRTAAPLLVIGNRRDPATPYSGAVALARLMPRARLLTVDVTGHTSLGQTQCSARISERYLLWGALPAPGTVCRTDRDPFARPTDQERALQQALSRVLPGPYGGPLASAYS